MACRRKALSSGCIVGAELRQKMLGRLDAALWVSDRQNRCLPAVWFTNILFRPHRLNSVGHRIWEGLYGGLLRYLWGWVFEAAKLLHRTVLLLSTRTLGEFFWHKPLSITNKIRKTRDTLKY